MKVLMVEPGKVPYAAEIGEGAIAGRCRRGHSGCLPLR